MGRVDGLSENGRRMPKAAETPQVAPRVIHALVMELERWQQDEAAVRAQYPWAERFVMGLPLAPWQRPFVWTREQSVRFIQSAWTGVHLGHYVLTEDRMKSGGKVEYEYLANMVIEGQQRLRALELYLTNDLAVPDEEGVPTVWRDVARIDQTRFKRVIFGCGTVRESDEAKLREFYDLMNFGGTAHTEEQRAS
jgi:hypothetical protein